MTTAAQDVVGRAVYARDGKLTIPLQSSYLDNAPKVDTRGELSTLDKARLDQLSLPKAA